MQSYPHPLKKWSSSSGIPAQKLNTVPKPKKRCSAPSSPRVQEPRIQDPAKDQYTYSNAFQKDPMCQRLFPYLGNLPDTLKEYQEMTDKIITILREGEKLYAPMRNLTMYNHYHKHPHSVTIIKTCIIMYFLLKHRINLTADDINVNLGDKPTIANVELPEYAAIPYLEMYKLKDYINEFEDA
jgi:hypothetical protein